MQHVKSVIILGTQNVPIACLPTLSLSLINRYKKGTPLPNNGNYLAPSSWYKLVVVVAAVKGKYSLMVSRRDRHGGALQFIGNSVPPRQDMVVPAALDVMSTRFSHNLIRPARIKQLHVAASPHEQLLTDEGLVNPWLWFTWSAPTHYYPLPSARRCSFFLKHSLSAGFPQTLCQRPQYAIIRKETTLGNPPPLRGCSPFIFHICPRQKS